MFSFNVLFIPTSYLHVWHSLAAIASLATQLTMVAWRRDSAEAKVKWGCAFCGSLVVFSKALVLFQPTKFVTLLLDEWSDTQSAVCCVIAAFCKWKSWEGEYGSQVEQSQQASIYSLCTVLGCIALLSVLYATTTKTVFHSAITAVALIVLQPSYRTCRCLRLYVWFVWQF